MTKALVGVRAGYTIVAIVALAGSVIGAAGRAQFPSNRSPSGAGSRPSSLWIESMADSRATPRADQQSVAVSLGTINAVRGDTALVALAIFLGGSQVSQVISEVTFPTNQLSFEGTEAALPAGAGVTIEAVVLPGAKSAPLATVRVVIKSKESVPEGALVKLKFKISAKTPGGPVALKHTAQAITSDGQKLDSTAKDGRINVAEKAVYSCFFYMH